MTTALVIDAGSGGARAALYDHTGARLAHAERPWRAHSVPALAPFGREYTPATVTRAIDDAVGAALRAVDPSIVDAVACTGQRVACAFLDAHGELLYAGPSGDVRALAGAALDDLDAAALYRTTGRFPAWIHAPARLRWFEAQAPQTFARVRAVVSFGGIALHALTGEAVVDPTTAADLSMLDVARGVRALTSTGLDDDAWPRLAAATDVAGEVTQAAAERFGLRPGLPVAVGLADTHAALPFGGADTLVAGSTAPLLRAVDSPVRDPKERLWLDPHPTPGRFCVEANLGEMGALHRWLVDALAIDGFDAFEALARQAAPGCRGASSHLGPRAMDLRNLSTGRPAALMMPFGETSLSAAPGRAELARSYLESCAFAACAGRAWLDAVADAPDGVHVVGGLSRSALVAEVLASTLEAPVWRGPADATARGAAACALVAAGHAAGLDEAVEMLRVEPVRHDPVDDYEDAYERWLDREEQLEEG